MGKRNDREIDLTKGGNIDVPSMGRKKVEK